MSMIAHSSSSRFSIGVPVIASVRRARSRRSARARLVAGFFTSCASSRTSRSQATAASASTSRVAMSYEVITTSLARGDARELDSGQPLAAVMDVNPQRWSEPLDLARPLAGDAHRADDERGAERIGAELLALRGQHRDRLHRLAEAHVVGQDRTDPEVAEQAQPAVAALLEREQRMGHRRRSPERVEVPVVAALEQLRRAIRRGRPRRARARHPRPRCPRRPGRDRRPILRGAGRGRAARARPRIDAGHASGRAPGSAAPSPPRAPRAPLP